LRRGKKHYAEKVGVANIKRLKKGKATKIEPGNEK